MLIFYPTPHRCHWTVLWVGIFVHHRVLPLSWQVVPHQDPWPHTLETLLPALLEPIAAALPAGCTVTLLATARFLDRRSSMPPGSAAGTWYYG